MISRKNKRSPEQLARESRLTELFGIYEARLPENVMFSAREASLVNLTEGQIRACLELLCRPAEKAESQ